MDLTLGLDATRGRDPGRYAIGGAVPRNALRPESRAEVAECLRAASRERLAVAPWGGGASIARERRLQRYDVALDLTALDRIVEYDPEDFTLTAECGATLETLGRTLAARGQELPLEGAFAPRATLGGVLATNGSGPRRLRFGAPRDRILGAGFALSDGTLARSGGKVVKNVAGYALHRLLCGSRGGLAALLEASLKLAPAPQARAALVFHVDGAALADEKRWAFLPRLEPAAVTILGPDAARAVPTLPTVPEFTAVVSLEDDAPWVSRQAERVVEALGAPAVRLEGTAAAALAQQICDAAERDAPRLTFTTAWNSPLALGVLIDGPLRGGLLFHTMAGRLHLEPRSENPASAVRRLAQYGFTLIETCGVDPIEPPLPPLAAVRDLRRRLHDALDPGGIWALGASP